VSALPPRPAGRRLDGRIDVSRSGRRLDLLVDGISYSTFHPDRPWSGYVWDALAVASLLPATREPEVLLLGGGAATALLLLRRLRPDAKLLAIELDERVAELARERFDLDRIGVDMVVDDGLEFLARSRRRFDLILDDMYAPSAAGLRRPVEDETAHLRRIAARLDPAGVAATNSTTDEDPPGLERALREAYRAVFDHRVLLRPRLGYNVVIAGSRVALRTGGIRSGLDHLMADDRAGVTAVRVRRD
jgi:spermidine synthase